MNTRIDPETDLRPMEPGDVRRVMEIELQVYPFPWTEGIFLDCLRVGYECWVMERDARLVGYLVLSSAAGEAHLLNIAVEAGSQGRGLGRCLLRQAVSRVRVLGAEVLLLEVRPSNESAVSLYRSEGFVRVGVRRRYYPAGEDREDAWIFSLSV